MKKNLKILFALLIASILIMACGLGADVATEAPSAAEPAAVGESAAQEPTAEPEPTAVPDMDLSSLVLEPADFPDVAFTAVPMAEMGLSMDDLSSENFTVESSFTLLEPTNFEMVMGFTSQVNGILGKAGFDLVLNQPEILMESSVGGMGNIDTSQAQEMPEFKDTIGDSSAGITIVANIEGTAMRVDMVVFRTKSIGAVAIVMYLDGQTPPVSLMDVATAYDNKIETFLSNQ